MDDIQSNGPNESTHKCRPGVIRVPDWIEGLSRSRRFRHISSSCSTINRFKFAPTCPAASIVSKSDATEHLHFDPDTPTEAALTEIPAHLLARAKKARAARGDAASETPSTSDTPQPAKAAVEPVAATPTEPEKPQPVAPFVSAANKRKVLPVWIMPVLLFLPIWAIYYVGFLERPPASPTGLTFVGDTVYNTQGCAGCHGANGQGGSGRALRGGEVLLTFPDLQTQIDAGVGSPFDGLASQISWVVNGTAGTRQVVGGAYGDPNRPGGQHGTGSFGNMGAFGPSLSIEQLVAVVHYERVTHGQLAGAAAESEQLVLEEFVKEAEASGLAWSNQSPAEIHALLEDARAALAGA